MTRHKGHNFPLSTRNAHLPGAADPRRLSKGVVFCTEGRTRTMNVRHPRWLYAEKGLAAVAEARRDENQSVRPLPDEGDG